MSLTVTAIPKPVISAIANAASYAQGAVSPGENIVIFGSGIGPATLTHADRHDHVLPDDPREHAGVLRQHPGSDHLRPDGPDQRHGSVRRVGPVRAPTSGWLTPACRATQFRITWSRPAPGIYTANSSGTGQGAILNQDFTVNTASRPAAKDSVVTVYLTGEGATSAPPTPSLDGRIAPIDGTGLYKPNLAVTATIGGQPATVEYYGTAPGIVYGVMQVNLRISANAASGNQPVVISVGPSNSQSNVTLAVQ